MKNIAIFIILIGLGATPLFAQPAADFAVDMTEGCASLAVNFADNSIGNITTYAWDFGNGITSNQMNPSLIYTQDGTYTVCLEVTDDQGQSDEVCMTDLIIVYDSPTTVIDDILCSGQSINVNGIIYDETAPSGLEVIAGGSVNGCDSTIVVNLTFLAADDLGLIDGYVIPIPCGMAAGGGACVTSVQCGVEPYMYDWGGPGLDQSCVNDLAAGTYNVTVTDAFGITGIANFLVLESYFLELDIVTTAVSCYGGTDGMVDFNVTGGNPPYTYETEPANIDIDNLQAGSYGVTVTDNSNCTVSDNFAIFEPLEIVIDPVTTSPVLCNEPVCVNLSSVIGGTPPYTYEWINGSTDVEVCDLPGGLYEATITDDNGCTATYSTTISSPASMVVTAQSTCAAPGNSDGIIDISVTGGAAPYEFLWTGGAITEDISGLTDGWYTVTVTDASNCTVEATFETNDLIEYITPDTTVCSLTPFQLLVDAPGAVSYAWYDFGTLDDPTIADPTIIDFQGNGGTWTVTVTNGAGCEDEGAVVLGATDQLIGVVENIVHPDCNTGNDGAITVTQTCGTGPYTYSWDPVLPNSNVQTGLTEGYYSVTIEDALGETAEINQIHIYDNSNEIIEVEDMVVCEGDILSACILPVAGDNQDSTTWTVPNPGGNISFSQNCMTINPVTSADAGTYIAVAHFEGGCTRTMEFEVVVETIEVTADTEICAGNAIDLSLSSAGIATVIWSPDDGSLSCIDCPDPVAAPLTTTTYDVMAISLSGCLWEESVTITVDPNCVWPGDTDTNKVVNNFDLLNIGLAMDSTGPIRPAANLMWFGQPGPDWMQGAPNGSNYKHIDTNGDGLISATDTTAISLNWGELHNFTGNGIPVYPPADQLTVTVPFYVQPDTLIEGAMMSLPVILGEMGNPAENVYGIAFTLEYDPEVIVAGSVYMGFDQSWLGDGNVDLISMHRDFYDSNKVDIGMTRTDGTPITDFGALAELFITVEDDLLLFGGGVNGALAIDEAVFNISNVLVINQFGEEIPVIPMETSSQIGGTTGIHDPSLGDRIEVYPNPVSELLWVDTKNIKLERIELTDLNGRTVKTIVAPREGKQSIDIKELGVGTYFVKVMTSEGVYVDRVVVVW